jgi:hypothetical protein
MAISKTLFVLALLFLHYGAFVYAKERMKDMIKTAKNKRTDTELLQSSFLGVNSQTGVKSDGEQFGKDPSAFIQMDAPTHSDAHSFVGSTDDFFFHRYGITLDCTYMSVGILRS